MAKYLIFPKLYNDSTSAAEINGFEDDLFVPVNGLPESGTGLCSWVQVECVCWGIYRIVGKSFNDYVQCYRKVK